MYEVKGHETIEELKKKGKLSFLGKLLAPNFFKPAPLSIQFEGFQGVAYVQVADRWHLLSACPLVGSNWCIVGVRLVLFDEEWGNRFLKPQHFNREGLERLKREVKEDLASPQVLWPQLSAKPVLQLTDTHGGFGKLLSDWGDGKLVPGMAGEKDLLEVGFVRRGEEYYCPLDQVGESLQLLLEVGWTILDAKGRPLALQTGMELEVAEEGSQLHLKGKVLFGQGQAAVEEVVVAYQRHVRLLPLADGQVALLPQSSPLAQVKQVKIERARGGEFSALPAVIDASLEPLLRFRGFEQVSPHEDFRGVLRPYQLDGLAWLHYLAESGYGGVLSDEMGLGKTVQVLAFLSGYRGPHLIVAPTSLLFNWRREMERFLPGRTDIDIVSYGTLRRGIEGTYQAAILDEAQNIKNPASQTAQAAYEIKAEFRLALSGTPIENRPAELWSLFRFAMPSLLGEMRNTIEKGRVRPFVLRRTKAEVAKELPEKIEQTVFIELGEEQKQVYDSITGAPLERILRFRQCCCHPLLVGSEVAQSAKLDALLLDLETVALEGKKGLIFSQFTEMLTLIGRELAYPYVRLDGSTRDREAVVRQFQEDPQIPFFLISLKAGGVGLNLTKADYVFLYDPWWNVSAENQAIDRAHRIGREGTVIAKRYIAAGTIEERLMELKAKKLAMGEEILGEGSFTLADMEQLLRCE